MDPLTSIGSAIDYRMPSGLNLMMYLHWHQMKDPDEIREKSADMCHLVRHDYDDNIHTCMILRASPEPVPRLMRRTKQFQDMNVLSCNRFECGDCFKAKGNLSFWFRGPWVCEEVLSILNGNLDTADDEVSLKVVWLDCLDKLPDQRCPTCQQVKNKDEIFHASQIAYAFWDQYIEDRKLSGWMDMWQQPMEAVTNKIERQRQGCCWFHGSMQVPTAQITCSSKPGTQ